MYTVENGGLSYGRKFKGIFTAQSIAEELRKKGVKYTADKITRTFRKILMEQLGFSEEEAAWFRSDSFSDMGGQFIFGFRRIHEVPDKMIRLMELFKKDTITADERDEIVGCLKEVMPVFRSTEDIKTVQKFSKLMDKDGEESIIQEILKRENASPEQCRRIEGLVGEYYVKGRTEFFFQKEIFVNVNAKRINKISVRHELYGYQYSLVRDWAIKWYFIMQDIEAVRIAERFEFVYYENEEMWKKEQKSLRQQFYRLGKMQNEDLDKLYQETDLIEIQELLDCVLVLFEEKKNSGEEFADLQKKLDLNKYGMKDVNTNELCSERCRELVSKIITHSLKETSIQDYNYIMAEAFEELESTPYEVRKKEYESCYCLEVEGRKKDDLDKLNRMREMIENRKRKRLVLEVSRQK